MTRTAANRRRSRNPGAEPTEGYADYVVSDPEGRKIGRVKELFTNARGEPEYVRVGMAPFGLRSILIPVGFVAVEEGRKTLTLQ